MPDRPTPARVDLLAEPRRLLTLDEVRSRREDILAAAGRHGVRDVRVFGSVARGDATSDSDLDLLVEIAPGRSLLDLAGFAVEVQDLLGIFTQVVTLTVCASGSGRRSSRRRSLCENGRRSARGSAGRVPAAGADRRPR
jgi:predicted nucleotidyltransferase